VVIDHFARNVVGWSMKPILSRKLAPDALMMAVWRRKPDDGVIVHSDQDSQYGSDYWQRFCRANNLPPRMGWRGNCWDNAVAESFFNSLKKESIRKRIYITRNLARTDIFDYIEVFCNRPRRRQSGCFRTGLVVRTEFVYGYGVSPTIKQDCLPGRGQSSYLEYIQCGIPFISALKAGHSLLLSFSAFTKYFVRRCLNDVC